MLPGTEQPMLVPGGVEAQPSTLPYAPLSAARSP